MERYKILNKHILNLKQINQINIPSLTASPRLYEDKILALIEDIRLRMCYNDPDGLPQLDPFLLPQQLDLDLDTDFGK